MEKVRDPDFLALAYIMAGSCFGRAKTREEALRLVKREAKDFARPFGGFKKGVELAVNLFDLSDSGINQVTWDDLGVKGDGKPMTVKPEIVKLVMA